MSVHNIYKEEMTDDDVYIGRAGHGRDGYFGNPFRVQAGNAVAKFEKWAEKRIEIDPVYREAVRGLHGKRLFCFCKPKECHGDVLDKLAERLYNEER
jgi:hypothetical protein